MLIDSSGTIEKCWPFLFFEFNECDSGSGGKISKRCHQILMFIINRGCIETLTDKTIEFWLKMLIYHIVAERTLLLSRLIQSVLYVLPAHPLSKYSYFSHKSTKSLYRVCFTQVDCIDNEINKLKEFVFNHNSHWHYQTKTFTKARCF